MKVAFIKREVPRSEGSMRKRLGSARFHINVPFIKRSVSRGST